jgi:dTDP-4-dehydrorhamnose 3,5-epimerase
MKITPTSITGAFVVQADPKGDSRGSFTRLFCDRELKEITSGRSVVQINHSFTAKKGSIRGLHYQVPPSAEMKLVRCLKGRVWDVALDLRKGSPTFLQYFATELSPESHSMYVIPEGCAHGFQTLSDDCEMLYLHTAHYDPKLEAAIKWNDPLVNIQWPLPPSDISNRDQSHPLLTKTFSGIEL